ncbi:MAG: phosphoribosylanthranilate isomerase [Proteobacteria bacterium]|nr:phosphoribosylanthranilate isomerase [Pseudomonadota bacterium]
MLAGLEWVSWRFRNDRLPVNTLIKVCGVTTPADAEFICAAGVDLIGLNYYQNSSRHVTPAYAAEIARAAGDAKLVGVFVNPEYAEVRAALDTVPLDWLQFHGSETPAFCASFDKPFIKATGVSGNFDFASFAERYSHAFAYLLDAHDTQHHGGTGRVFDWQLWPESTKPLILSGGLTAENVSAAIARMHPWAVDVASGVEADVQGRKDPTRVEAFVRKVLRSDGRA